MILTVKLSDFVSDYSLKKLEKYAELIERFPGNLLSRKNQNVETIMNVHIPDSLAIISYFGGKISGEILDMGSGAGFPSVPSAICLPNVKIFAVDSSGKKINFLNTVKSELELDNFFPVCARLEENNPLSGKKFDIITSRALAGTELLLKYASKYSRKGTVAVFHKSLSFNEELASSEKILSDLKFEYSGNFEYKIENAPELTRILSVFEKL